jgi:hypothetical protein
MVNNSANINKMNIHLKPFNTIKTKTCDIENPDPGLRQARKCGAFNPVKGIPLLINGSPIATDINKQ